MTDRHEDGVAAAERPPAWRRIAARTDPFVVTLAAASLLLSAAFLGVSLAYNQGRLIPPLDDVYIHLQYGRQLGLGEPFRYVSGEPVTLGASSLLYALVLGAAHAAGFHGSLLLAFAVGFGALCAAAATVLTYRTGRALAGRTAGVWAGVLTALSGPLLWGAVSGMEIGLVAVLLAGAVHAFVREHARGTRFVATPLVAALLAITRPEGLIVAVGLVAGMLWTLGRAVHAGRLPVVRAAARAGLAVLPLLAGAGQLLFHVLATGSVQANGVLAKSWLHAGLLFQPLEVADLTLRNLQQMLASLTGLSGQDFVPPATLVLAVLGLVSLAARRYRTLAAVLAFGLATVLLSVATLSTAQWQNLRYLQPFVPLFLLLAVLGVHGVSRLGGHRDRQVLHGLLAVVLLFTIVVTPTWALRLGQQASAMREGPVSVANWLSGNVPPGDSVAVNDVGAAAWFGGHRTVDLIGLTTNGMAAPSLNGPGTLYEALRHLPPEQRPDWFAIFDRWGGVRVSDLGRAAVLGAEPVITFQLTAPPRPISVTAPQTCQIDRSCDRVSVWKADWSLDSSADLPDLPVPGTIRDHLNVADMTDEAVHDWSVQPPVLGLQPGSVLDRTVVGADARSAGAPLGGRVVADSGRRVVGGETFTLRELEPGRPVTLTGRIGVSRTGAAEETHDVAVRVDGRPAGTWALPAGTPWAQASLTIPGRLVTGTEITVSTGPEREFLAPYPDYRSYGWWVSQ